MCWFRIDHFTVVCSVTWPLDDSEGRVDFCPLLFCALGERKPREKMVTRYLGAKKIPREKIGLGFRAAIFPRFICGHPKRELKTTL